MASQERRDFHQQWSDWRRQHQAVANRCHQVRRSQHLMDTPPPSLPPALVLSGLVPLTEEIWRQIRAELPSEKPKTGRPGMEHRRILEGILWVMGTGNAWRSVPERYGRWPTLYSRYQRWCANGQWSRICPLLLAPSP